MQAIVSMHVVMLGHAAKPGYANCQKQVFCTLRRHPDSCLVCVMLVVAAQWL